MHQLTQKLKTGEMKVVEVPLPDCGPQQVLVRNYYSLISAGTEESTVKAARKSLIGKAKDRPQQVKQALDILKTQGLVQTYRTVMKKLDSLSPLGYSCAGEVVAVGDEVKGFVPGNLVACGGLSASHAEFVSVPSNLCVNLKVGTDLKQAAYNTLGSIALQGVRQGDLQLGETCAVIGLGLVGQLTCLLLRASGVRVVGIDIDPTMVEIAGKHCTDLSLVRNDSGIEGKISEFTNGLGCDAVIITAATDSLDPINFAGAISRKKGSIVVVGAVPTGFDREPHFYRKELQVRMSCSYGPGRYDPVYEEKGIDYPAAYVRWTEKRNMEAFQSLIASGKVDVNYLTTHIFKLDDAPKAYDMILTKSEPYIGILIEYDVSKPRKNKKIPVRPSSVVHRPSSVSIGFIGAGSYAQSYLLPNIPKSSDVVLKGVMTATGTSSRSVAERFGFEFCTGDEKDILENPDINTVFIATRHDSHAEYVVKALKAGKHVFVEKPLCITESELIEITNVYSSLITHHSSLPLLMVGYNRRFSPFAYEVRAAITDSPVAMNYRINAGAIPPDSWVQDPQIGGGRVVGEVCHFVDLLIYLAGSYVKRLHAEALQTLDSLEDTLNVTLAFENGSIGSVSYFSNGDKGLPKERLEVFVNGCCYVLDDYRRLVVNAKGKERVKKLPSQDKGQKNEIRLFIEHILGGKGPLILSEELFHTSRATFGILESLRHGHVVLL